MRASVRPRRVRRVRIDEGRAGTLQLSSHPEEGLPAGTSGGRIGTGTHGREVER